MRRSFGPAVRNNNFAAARATRGQSRNPGGGGGFASANRGGAGTSGS